MVNDLLDDLQINFEKTVEALKRELGKVRTGRASLNILDGIRVDYYGTSTPLNQVAALAVADPRLITIKPWERNMISAVERAIIQADLGINPSNDGELIRLPIPPLTGERRKELVKLVKKAGEDAKIGLRNHRRDTNDLLKVAEKDGDISEDEMNRGLKRVQELTDEWVKKVDDNVAKKEKDVQEV